MTESPKPPSSLKGKVARAKWKSTAAVLVPAGLLTECDLDALATYCMAWQDVADCDDALAKDGAFFKADSGYVGQHPAVSRRYKAMDVIRRFHTSFGMTPAARNAVTVAPAAKDDQESEFFG